MAPQKVMYGVERSKANYCNMQWYYSISYESLSLICDSLWWQLKVYFNLCPFIGAQEQEKIYRQHLLCWDQRHLPTACRRHEPHPTTQLSMVKYTGAKLHHLAGKVSKSCYKLREDRVAHHLWTLHWCPGDVMRMIPPLSDAKKITNDWNENGFNCHRLLKLCCQISR